MSVEVFDRILANLDIPVKVCFLHLCGEPFLNPELDYFCSRLLERKIIPTIFSNGYGIDLTLLDKILKLKGIRISFSMEIHAPEDYEAIRTPGRYERAKQCLEEINRHFAEANRVFGLNIILTDCNAKNAEKISRALFDRYSRLSNITFSSEWPWPGLPQTGNLAGHLSSHNSMCSQVKSLPTILWDGRISFCNLDYGGEMIVGDMTDTPLSRIVNNPSSRRFRKLLAMRDLPEGSLCSRCVLPRYNSFTLNITRGKLRNLDQTKASELFSPTDDYFRQ